MLAQISIDTSAVAGSAGKLAFDFIVNTPSFLRYADILNFSAPGGTAGLPETRSGLVEGDLILPPFNSGAHTRIGGGFFFNELMVNITGAPGGQLSVFSPTVFTPPDILQITVPGPTSVGY